MQLTAMFLELDKSYSGFNLATPATLLICVCTPVTVRDGSFQGFLVDMQLHARERRELTHRLWCMTAILCKPT